MKKGEGNLSKYVYGKARIACITSNTQIITIMHDDWQH